MWYRRSTRSWSKRSMKDFSGRCSDGRGGDHKVGGGHRDEVLMDKKAAKEVNQEVDKEV